MPRPPNSPVDLKSIARRAMIEHGLEPDLPPDAAVQLRAIAGPAVEHGPQIRDLRALLWCSIDNDDSRDLDQLSVAQPLADGAVRILVAIADVDASIARGSPLDGHARANTTSVYTAAQVFPMLPERLSTDLTCLAGHRPPPPRLAAVAGMDQQLRIQDGVAQALKRVRRAQGALALTTLEAQAVYDGAQLIDLKPDENNRGKELIEFFMIAANGVVARFLESRGSSSLRRALREPERWERIVALARGCGETLPPTPDPRALSEFLVKRQQAAPAQFPDLSLAVVKLLGAGEYVLKRHGQPSEGHFGLAVDDYTHATAPNRRFPDVITQRLLKAALNGAAAPYSDEELRALGAHCTEQERNAAKVERQVRKSAAALLLQGRIGEQFDAMVTGASQKGTWVRITEPLAEGRVVKGFEGLDVGDTVRVQLLRTDVQRGFIDFARLR